jgi:predicted nuclease with TOPRIM domain
MDSDTSAETPRQSRQTRIERLEAKRAQMNEKLAQMDARIAQARNHDDERERKLRTGKLIVRGLVEEAIERKAREQGKTDFQNWSYANCE